MSIRLISHRLLCANEKLFSPDLLFHPVEPD